MNNPEKIEVPKTGEVLYAKHEPVFNRRIDGKFRRLKWAVMVGTLAVYYITPWLRWNRGAHAPDQAVLLDLANRRFFLSRSKSGRTSSISSPGC